MSGGRPARRLTSSGSGVLQAPSGPSAQGPTADFDCVIEEIGGADTLFEQMDVGAQREAGIGVAEPGLDLLDVLAVGEKE